MRPRNIALLGMLSGVILVGGVTGVGRAVESMPFSICVRSTGALYVAGDAFSRETCMRNHRNITSLFQGLRGERGPAGTQGEQGAVGLTGDIGLTGPQGAQGEQGMRGEDGFVGPAGPQGESGATGPQGPTGEQGVPGLQGEIGPQGLTGTFDTTGFHTHIVCVTALGNLGSIKAAHGGPTKCPTNYTEVEMVFRD